MYYQSEIVTNKTNIRKVWKIIKQVINRKKGLKIHDKFMHNNNLITDPKSIADSFNNYSVSPIYRGRVYRGIGYIAVASWTPFLATHFTTFADMTLKSAIFREIAVIPWTPFARDSFSRNLLTADAFDPALSQETIFREICSGPIWLTCEMRAGAHAVRWPATEGGSLTPPLYHRVGSY